jgi:hypothetical protein
MNSAREITLCWGNLHHGIPSVTFCLPPARIKIHVGTMTNLPHSHTNWRTPRVRITEITPVVLRLPDGGHHRGKLETISLTGGLLSVPHTLNRGSRISLMFLTRSGPVLGTAEMLSPVSTEQQPFRFVALDRDVQHRLKTMVQPLLNPDEDVWIAKYRAARVHHSPMRGGVVSRIVLGSLSLVTFLLSAAYLLHVHLLR